MISKYPGKCRICGKPYRVGDEINWSKEDGASHPACRPAEQGELLAESEAEELAERLGFRKHDEF
jgi:hypothetical protein